MRLQNLALIVFGSVSIAAISCQNHASQSTSSTAKGPSAGTAGATGVDTSQWKTYRNEQYGFELKYPATWRRGGEGSGTQGATGQPAEQTRAWMMEIRKPHWDDEPDAKVSLGVQENQNPKKLSIDEYVAEQLRVMKTVPDSSGRLTIAERPAVFLETTSSSGEKVRATYMLLYETDLLSFVYKHQEPFDATLSAIVSSVRVVK